MVKDQKKKKANHKAKRNKKAPVKAAPKSKQHNSSFPMKTLHAGVEPLAPVLTSTEDFKVVQTYYLNPGDVVTFPRLSKIAHLYDNYRFRKLVFRYKTAVSTFANGRAYLAYDANVYDDNRQSTRSELLQLTHTEAAVYRDFRHAVPSNQLGTMRFCRDRTQWPPGITVDLKTYDLGTLSVATEAVVGGGTVGFLEVEYEVEFLNPNDGKLGIPAAVVDSFQQRSDLRISAANGGSTYTSTPSDWGGLPVNRTGSSFEGSNPLYFQLGVGRGDGYWINNPAGVNTCIRKCRVNGTVTVMCVGNRQNTHGIQALKNSSIIGYGMVGQSEATGPNSQMLTVNFDSDFDVGDSFSLVGTITKNGGTYTYTTAESAMFVFNTNAGRTGSAVYEITSLVN